MSYVSYMVAFCLRVLRAFVVDSERVHFTAAHD
jgi:hypothetical protein